MPKKVIDLGSSRVITLPDLVVLDTNLIIAHLMSPWKSDLPRNVIRAQHFFHLLSGSNSAGVITSTTLGELFHFLIKAKYESEIAGLTSQLSRQYPGRKQYYWHHVYKMRSGLLTRYSRDLKMLVTLLIANDILILQPQDLAPLSDAIENEMIRRMDRYQLTQADAAILLEAYRAGVESIASLDGDMRRAAQDFDVYTWI